MPLKNWDQQRWTTPISETKLAAKLYYAVRKSDSLQSPAIFTSWEDCNSHVDFDWDNNTGTCVYQPFAKIEDAVEYIKMEDYDDDSDDYDVENKAFCPVVTKDSDDKEDGHSNDDKDDNDDDGKNKQPPTRTGTTTSVASNHQSLDSSLPLLATAAAATAAEATIEATGNTSDEATATEQASSPTPTPPTKAAPTPEKQSSPTVATKKAAPSSTPAVEGGKIIIVAKNKQPLVVGTTAASRKRPPTTSSPKRRPLRKRTKTTEAESSGSEDETDDSDDDSVSVAEVMNDDDDTRTRTTNGAARPARTSTLSPARSAKPFSTTPEFFRATTNDNHMNGEITGYCEYSIRFESQFKILQEFKAKFGHCRVPGRTSPEFKQLDERFQSLDGWLLRQRKRKKMILSNDADVIQQQQEEESENPFFSREQTIIRLQRLDDLMGSLDLGAKFDKFEDNLVLLKAYKDQHGHCQVPGPKHKLYRSLDDKYKGLYGWIRGLRARKRKLLPNSDNGAEEQNLEQDLEQELEQDLEQELERALEHEQEQEREQEEDQQLEEEDQQGREEEEEKAPATNNNNDKLFTNVWEMQFGRLEEILGPDGYDGQREDDWHKYYDALLKHKKKHGNFSIPESKKDLRNFLTKMKQHITKYKADPVAYKKGYKRRWFLDEYKFQKLTEELGLKEYNSDSQKPKNKCVTGKGAPTWDEMFAELCKFREIHGHCDVPYSKPSTLLRNWVVHQRIVFGRLKEVKRNDSTKKEAASSALLTPERIAKLTSIGFTLTVKSRLSWDERALQWLEFKTKNGRDPTTEDPGPEGRWQQKQRHYYSLYKQGKKSPVSKAQFDKLESWGFTFSTGIKRPESVAPSKPWIERYQELLAYRAEHGHVNVPQKYPILGHWVHRQRRDYALMNQGRKSAMNEYKLKKLNEIDFVFLTR